MRDRLREIVVQVLNARSDVTREGDDFGMQSRKDLGAQVCRELALHVSALPARREARRDVVYQGNSRTADRFEHDRRSDRGTQIAAPEARSRLRAERMRRGVARDPAQRYEIVRSFQGAIELAANRIRGRLSELSGDVCDDAVDQDVKPFAIPQLCDVRTVERLREGAL